MVRKRRWFSLFLLVVALNGVSAAEAVGQRRLAGVLTFESLETGVGVVARRADVASLDSVVARSGRHSIRITQEDIVGEADLFFGYPSRLTSGMLELRAWLKTEGLTGSAELVVSASGVEDKVARSQRVSGSTDWARYRIAMPLTVPADFAHFGLEVVGSGTVWVDDLALLLDGVPVIGSVEGTLSNRGCMFAGLRSDSWQGAGAFEFEFLDGLGIRGDGRGPYRAGVDRVETYLENSGIRLYPHGRGDSSDEDRRSVTLNLDRPLSGAQKYGTREIDALVVHWTQDNQGRVIAGLLDMPIGTVELSERLEIFVSLGSRRHILRFGELDVTHCWSAAFLDGSGTTQPVIERISETEWIVHLPDRAIGRLAEWFGQPADAASGHFEDRGLYELGGRFMIRWLNPRRRGSDRSFRMP